MIKVRKIPASRYVSCCGWLYFAAKFTTMRILFFFIACLFAGTVVQAQPTGSKTKASAKKTVKPRPVNKPVSKRKPADEMLSDFGDGRYIFGVQPGDTLVYDVNAMGNQYEFHVIIKKFTTTAGILFDWKMTDPVNKSGQVAITKEGQETNAYKNYFAGGTLTLTNASTVWLTGRNFRELPDKKTEMIIDDNDPETFVLPENDEVSPEINYRGKLIKLDGFILTNNKTGFGQKEIHALNISANPLIIYMNLGWTIKLKAVR